MLQLVDDIIETIRDVMNIEPVENEPTSLKNSSGEDIPDVGHSIHFPYLLDILIMPNEESSNLFDVGLSWYADVKPTIVSELSIYLDYLPQALLIVSDSFAYDNDMNLVWGEEAEKQVAQDHFDMVEDEILRQQKEYQQQNEPRYDLRLFKEPSTH